MVPISHPSGHVPSINHPGGATIVCSNEFVVLCGPFIPKFVVHIHSFTDDVLARQPLGSPETPVGIVVKFAT